MTFARSKEEANQLAAIIDNARMRLAVALDIPIMDEDEVDDDGGAAA
jgi:hypothetical protein